MEEKYYLDEKEIDFDKLIEKAQGYGYGKDSFLLRTSEACKVLEDNGHKVEHK